MLLKPIGIDQRFGVCVRGGLRCHATSLSRPRIVGKTFGRPSRDSVVLVNCQLVVGRMKANRGLLWFLLKAVLLHQWVQSAG